MTLSKECQFLAGEKSAGVPYSLQVIVVHQRNSKRGHYVTYLKPEAGPFWVCFNDHIVGWVSEKDVLTQEATILIYTRLDRWEEKEIIVIPDDAPD